MAPETRPTGFSAGGINPLRLIKALESLAHNAIFQYMDSHGRLSIGMELTMKVLWARWRVEYILGEDKTPGLHLLSGSRENLAERLIFFNGGLPAS